ncbi:MAG: hypothetical protein K8H88_08675 [Sandaracinaceae bacterium]|nr:hypothetical protein [Sandaracinaceae bacterium]
MPPATASAYDAQWSLDLGVGWGVAPALSSFPNNGPATSASAGFGIGDTWALRPTLSYAVHPPFNGGDALHVLFGGVEGLYLIDILQVVPSFGAGIDVLATYDGRLWGADFAVHLVGSLDYLVSREFVIGVDIRPYFLLTALDRDPIYLSFLLRASVLFDY